MLEGSSVRQEHSTPQKDQGTNGQQRLTRIHGRLSFDLAVIIKSPALKLASSVSF